MSLNRRTLLSAGALAGAGLMAPGLGSAPAAAKAPLAGASPAFRRFKLGDFEVTTLLEGAATRPLDANFITNADLKDVQAVLAENHLATDKLTITFTPILVNTGSKLVLFDTGFADNGGPTNGKLGAQLAAAGVDPKDIDTVIISHFHGDHLQGLRAKAGSLVYPNAEIMVPEAEWAFWMDEGKFAAAPEGLKGAFQGVYRVLKPNAGDVKRFAWGSEISPGITAVDASGHTPGHTAFVIASGNARMMYVADLTNNPLLFARNPEWSAVFDMDAAKAVASRKRILDMAAAEKLQLSFYHANFPASGFVTKRGNGFDFVPAAWTA